MKILLSSIIIVLGTTSFAQLEDYDIKYADTIYNNKNQIEKINTTTVLGDKKGVATYAYHPNDTIKSIDYEDSQGFAHFKYDTQGSVIFAHVRHYKSIPLFDYYEYDYAEDGKVLSIVSRDSTKALTQTLNIDYHEDGKVATAAAYDASGDLSYYRQYNYDDNGSLLFSEIIAYPGIVHSQSFPVDNSSMNQAYECRYIYDNDYQMEQIKIFTYRENGDIDDINYVFFNHEDGELVSFAYERRAKPTKLKKKHLEEEKWVKEYYTIKARNEKIQANN